MFYAWEEYFAEFENVKMSQGDILTLKGDAIVSPANSFSFGYMHRSGLQPARRVGPRESTARPADRGARRRTAGEAGRYRADGESRYPVLHFHSHRARSDEHREHRRHLSGIPRGAASRPRLQPYQSRRNPEHPLPGTGEGRVSHERCAWQMHCAHAVCVPGRVEHMGGLPRAVENHIDPMR